MHSLELLLKERTAFKGCPSFCSGVLQILYKGEVRQRCGQEECSIKLAKADPAGAHKYRFSHVSFYIPWHPVFCKVPLLPFGCRSHAWQNLKKGWKALKSRIMSLSHLQPNNSPQPIASGELSLLAVMHILHFRYPRFISLV